MKVVFIKEGIGKGLVEANGMVIWNEVMSMTGLSLLAPGKCKLINLCPVLEMLKIKIVTNIIICFEY